MLAFSFRNTQAVEVGKSEGEVKRTGQDTLDDKGSTRADVSVYASKCRIIQVECCLFPL